MIAAITQNANTGTVDPCSTNQYAYPNYKGPYNQADLSRLGYPAHHVKKRAALAKPVSDPVRIVFCVDSPSAGMACDRLWRRACVHGIASVRVEMSPWMSEELCC